MIEEEKLFQEIFRNKCGISYSAGACVNNQQFLMHFSYSLLQLYRLKDFRKLFCDFLAHFCRFRGMNVLTFQSIVSSAHDSIKIV